MFGSRNDNDASDYLSKRFNTGDDRCSNEKKMDDARLRGSIGERDANNIINAVDKIKSQR